MRLVERQEWHYRESGLDDVLLTNITLRVCTRCSIRRPLIPAMDRIHETIARALALKSEALTGAELRFLRKQLGMSAKGWAALMHVAPETLSRWENGASVVGPQSDVLARLLYLRICEERRGEFDSERIAERVGTLDYGTNPPQELVIDVDDLAGATFRRSA